MSLISALLGVDLPVKGGKKNMYCCNCGRAWSLNRPANKKPCPRCQSKNTKAVVRRGSSYMGVS